MFARDPRCLGGECRADTENEMDIVGNSDRAGFHFNLFGSL